MADRYSPHDFESAWQDRWEQTALYRTPADTAARKFYCLDFFPYPSGAGLSVGHCHNYVPTDVISRVARMRGLNVLHPMGWDAFGLPAENEAINKGVHPTVTTANYVANYKRQLRLIGTSYDWEREINSSSPEYYRWTQWFFLLLYKRGLAYRSDAPANWCPSCQTVLANEEVEDGKCWRCGSQVERRGMPQWFFRITSYADELIDGLEDVDWPERIKLMQRNWIGRSEGVEFDLAIQGHDGVAMRVFTTRIDTVFGMTFCVLAPEHALVDAITTPDQRAAVDAYREKTRRMTDTDRLSTERVRDGVWTGAHAINPVNGEAVPVYIADYVLASYGTGAVMAVPAHDTRDFDFATRLGLPIRTVIQEPGTDATVPLAAAYVDAGTMVNSGRFDGMASDDAWDAIAADLESMGVGLRTVQYRIRDWLISRQRYWGAPIPIVYCPEHGELPVPESQLPVLLPQVEQYKPSGTGQSPLAGIPEFVNTTCPECGGPATRETDTMGGFACSSWYFLRFASPRVSDRAFDPEAVKYWLPVDLYVGGAEHAVMHLLYARFWTKVMADAGLLDFREPFTRLYNQGVVHAPDGARMSKSKGNVITPDSVVEEFGADTLRVYELFMAPFDQDVVWNPRSIVGVHRFLSRVWETVLDGWPLAERAARSTADIASDPRAAELRGLAHRTTRKVLGDYEKYRFNTAVSALMVFLTGMQDARAAAGDAPSDAFAAAWRDAMHRLLLLLAPIAPHLGDELWSRTFREGASIHLQQLPEWDDALAVEDSFELVLQINGKVRDKVQAPRGLGDDDAKALAQANDKMAAAIAGKDIVKIVYVKERLVNVVVKG